MFQRLSGSRRPSVSSGINTSPSVIYKVHKTGTDEVIELYNPSDMPSQNEISYMEEPFVSAEILTPKEYVGNIMEICQRRRGIYIDMKYLDENRVNLIYELPLFQFLRIVWYNY